MQLIELWETYLLQLDSDEDGPPLMPAGIRAEGEQSSDAQLRTEAAKAQFDAESAAGASHGHDELDTHAGEGTRSLSGETAAEDEGVPRVSEDSTIGHERDD